MLFLDLSNCGPSGLLRVIYFFKLILNILFIIIPIALIVLLIIDFAKMVISNDEGSQKKLFKLATKRILNAILVFFVPTFVSIFNAALGSLGVEYSSCYTDINIDSINMLAAEEEAKEAAEEAARLAALEEERKKAEAERQPTVSNPYVPSGSGCDGQVFYENGVFYIPTGLGGKEGTKGSAYSGHNKYFYDMLTKFLDAAKAAGHTIDPDDNAWRDYYEQKKLYECYIARNPSCNPAASPGTSKHNWGIASDIIYRSERSTAYQWGLENAAKFGLDFSEPDEDWHVQPVNIIIDYDGSKTNACK